MEDNSYVNLSIERYNEIYDKAKKYDEVYFKCKGKIEETLNDTINAIKESIERISNSVNSESEDSSIENDNHIPHID